MLHLAFESARDAFEKRSIKYENLISFRNLSPAPSPIVFGDYTRLIELFVNLIDNSAKYSGKKDTLRISVTLSRTTGTAIKDLLRTQVESQWERFLLIEYCDNGIGIKPTERKLIFQKGERGLAGRSKRDEGLGYGLYYCRKVMHAHRGNIIYSNSLYCVGGKGSFFLYFPEFTSASQLEAPKITHQR
nr:ATP-binding protein [Granulicella aggregans]